VSELYNEILLAGPLVMILGGTMFKFALLPMIRRSFRDMREILAIADMYESVVPNILIVEM
jgi:hypothetical protein